MILFVMNRMKIRNEMFKFIFDEVYSKIIVRMVFWLMLVVEMLSCDNNYLEYISQNVKIFQLVVGFVI